MIKKIAAIMAATMAVSAIGVVAYANETYSQDAVTGVQTWSYTGTDDGTRSHGIVTGTTPYVGNSKQVGITWNEANRGSNNATITYAAPCDGTFEFDWQWNTPKAECDGQAVDVIPHDDGTYSIAMEAGKTYTISKSNVDDKKWTRVTSIKFTPDTQTVYYDFGTAAGDESVDTAELVVKATDDTATTTGTIALGTVITGAGSVVGELNNVPANLTVTSITLK